MVARAAWKAEVTATASPRLRWEGANTLEYV